MTRYQWSLLTHVPGSRPWREYRIGVRFISTVAARLEREYGVEQFPWELVGRDPLALAFAVRGVLEILEHEDHNKRRWENFLAQRELAHLS